MADPQQVEQAIKILQAHQAILGDEVVEISLTALHKQLAELEQPLVSTSNLAGERKQVTVMFADISGFTAMSEKLDPEEVRRLINACFERLGEAIARYDGHIDKFIGDEIMALFGAPVAHENDPERALRAALEMIAALEKFNTENVAQLPQALALHFGINSGLVIAGEIGTKQRRDYSVMGDPVNLASRLEDLSEPGEILVGEDTYRLTAPLFEFEAREPVRVKGKAQPVRAYRLLRAKAEPDQIRGIEGLHSPLVGRQKEMALLQEVLAKLQQGQGGIISVIGDAGIGKSRLTRELYRLCTESTETRTKWGVGRALSYGENVSYLVARDLLRHFLNVRPETTLAEVGQILQNELDQIGSTETSNSYPYLAHLLEIPLGEEATQRIKYLSGEALNRQILQSIQDYLAAKTRQQPIVLVWEDLHWADPSSLGLLEALLDLPQQCPLLLILIYRPRHTSRIWTLHQKISQSLVQSYLSIELSALTDEDSQQLLKNLLGACNIPRQIFRLILTKAEGNPFYLEEVIRSLIDSGGIARSEDNQHWVATASIEDIPIPNTLQGVIMARIDRLSPELKRTLQVASVIGRSFSYDVLAQVFNEK